MQFGVAALGLDSGLKVAPCFANARFHVSPNISDATFLKQPLPPAARIKTKSSRIQSPYPGGNNGKRIFAAAGRNLPSGASQ